MAGPGTPTERGVGGSGGGNDGGYAMDGGPAHDTGRSLGAPHAPDGGGDDQDVAPAKGGTCDGTSSRGGGELEVSQQEGLA